MVKSISWRGLGLAGALVVVLGCGGRSTVPTDDAAENIRKLALGYVQYAAGNQGVGPADQTELEKFLVERHGFSPEDAKACFVSPRDNQPFIVRWGQRPFESGPVGPNPPKPAPIVAETNRRIKEKKQGGFGGPPGAGSGPQPSGGG